MDGIMELPNNSKIQVHDITKGTPEFMKQADLLFIDPPCNTGNLRSFYTKSNMELSYSFDLFKKSLFESIDNISPKCLCIEVFKSNKDAFLHEIGNRYKNITVIDSMYYNKKNNKCWVIVASNHDIGHYNLEQLNGVDEEKIIKWICENMTYNCIGDLCMGMGLVGKYAYLNKRQFVGTELNKKRLAKLIHFIETHEQQL